MVVVCLIWVCVGFWFDLCLWVWLDIWFLFVERDVDVGNNEARGGGGHWSLIWLGLLFD